MKGQQYISKPDLGSSGKVILLFFFNLQTLFWALDTPCVNSQTCLQALGALELAPEVLDLPVEEEGAGAVEDLLAVRARRPLRHVARRGSRLATVLRLLRGRSLLFLLAHLLIDVGFSLPFPDWFNLVLLWWETQGHPGYIV